MSSPLSSRERKAWQLWLGEADARARMRWQKAQKHEARRLSGRGWENAIRERLAPLCDLEILKPGDHQRIQHIPVHDLTPSARNAYRRMVQEAEIGAPRVYPISVAAGRGTAQGAASDRGHGLLQFYSGRRLLNGEMSLLVLIDEQAQRPLSMSIQVQGICPGRWQSTYLRYDLDAVQMGTGPAAHFNAHWHSGALPDASDAEEQDPRLPALPLDPDAVIDHLVLRFFPAGPEDVLDSDLSRERDGHCTSSLLKDLGERLREKRKRSSLVHEELYALTGLAVPFLRDVEEGLRASRDISLHAVELLARGLDCPLAWLIGEERAAK